MHEAVTGEAAPINQKYGGPDLSLYLRFKNSVNDWLANKIDEGIEKFKQLMDHAIKKSNEALSSAADNVRNSCGSG